MNNSIKHEIITVIHFFEHVFHLLLDSTAATYNNERVVLILGRHEWLNHFRGDATRAAHCPVFIWRLHNWEVVQFSLFFKLRQVLI